MSTNELSGALSLLLWSLAGLCLLSAAFFTFSQPRESKSWQRSDSGRHVGNLLARCGSCMAVAMATVNGERTQGVWLVGLAVFLIVHVAMLMWEFLSYLWSAPFYGSRNRRAR
jgi:hypothetical protein